MAMIYSDQYTPLKTLLATAGKNEDELRPKVGDGMKG